MVLAVSPATGGSSARRYSCADKDADLVDCLPRQVADVHELAGPLSRQPAVAAWKRPIRLWVLPPPRPVSSRITLALSGFPPPSRPSGVQARIRRAGHRHKAHQQYMWWPRSTASRAKTANRSSS